MLLRSANGVGYTNYPDNVVRYFVSQAAAHGVDLFRVFDSLNWVENMRVAIEAVGESGRLCEAAICYTGNLDDPGETKYDLAYYVRLAKELERAGAHVLGIKDMAGLCRPRSAYRLVKALKEEIGLPVHFHTHDTSGIAAASVLMAIDAGVDAVDGALDSMSGMTSQPNLGVDRRGAALRATRSGPRPGQAARAFQLLRAGAAWLCRIRIGDARRRFRGVRARDARRQYTNLREQARSLGIDDTRWHEVAHAYSQVNRMFGDIVKVTPSSKVVGDMALLMVTSGLDAAEVEDPDVEVAFPESVVSFFRGELGQPHGGFPEALQRKVLKGAVPLRSRPGETLPAVDLTNAREELQARIPRPLTDYDFASWLMYPKVYTDYVSDRIRYGDVSVLPTRTFFYGLAPGEEITVELERGKQLIIRLVTVSDAHDDGTRTVFFELNGQPRPVRVVDRSQVARRPPRRQVEPGQAGHVGAPMPGTVATVAVSAGHAGRARRGIADARSDEDGDIRSRRARCARARGAGPTRRAGRREGSSPHSRMRKPARS
jgi:pyruvate carboxylase